MRSEADMFIHLTTPLGKIAIAKNKIVSIVEITPDYHKNPVVLCEIYVDGDDKPFYILEDFGCIMAEFQD